jgi:ribosome biogenesis GTPase / thiamine phosphate phosphatase
MLPRRSTLQRKRPGGGRAAQVIAANVDIVLVAVALTEPLNPRRLERYVALAWESGAMPVVVLTKEDLCDDVAAVVAAAMDTCPGTDVVAISSTTGDGLDRLLTYLRPGRTAVILGQSGTGKSTLTNALLGESRMDTRAVRRDGKGRHTTTHRELVRLPNGSLLIDTPGLREVGLWDAADGVRTVFTDIDELAQGCRFADCRHASEPGCAVQAAAASGTLDPDRLEGWRRLERELSYLERRENRAAEAEAKSAVKAAHRALRSHMRSKRGR